MAAKNAPLALRFLLLIGALVVASTAQFALLPPPPVLLCDQSAQLAPCLLALLGTGPATAPCCTQLKAQQQCLCQYVPSLQSLTSTVGKNLLRACGLAPLSC